jgi:hypothetical protein
VSILSESRAALRIVGDDLVPAEITAMLGAAPTSCHIKGEADVLSSGTVRVRKTGLWMCATDFSRPADIDGQVAKLLGRLTSDMSVWQALGTRFEIDLSFGWFMEEGNEGAEMSVATLHSLAERGIKLDFDLYGP